MRGRVVGIIDGLNEVLVKLDEPVPFSRMDEVELGKASGHRSLNANAYFHKLLTLIAERLGNSNAYQKNLLLRQYGQYEYIGEKIPTIQVKSQYDAAMDQREDIHLNPIGRDGEYTKYAVMRGSHTYNTKEMARLIDGTVNEAKELGIETLSPDEIKRMELSWGRNQ